MIYSIKMNKEEEQFYNIGNSLKNSIPGKLFGKPCFKVNGKAYVCFFQNEMVFKLNDQHYKKAIELDGAQLFDPSGKKRPMREWVQVPYQYHELWSELAEASKMYVADAMKSK